MPIAQEQLSRGNMRLSWLEYFSPGHFAFVMATGIVSLTAHFAGRDTIAMGLFGLNVGAYLALCAFTGVRLACFRERFVEDLMTGSRSAAFLTKPAATCVLGCQFAILTPWAFIATALWFVGAGMAALLIPVFFAVCVWSDPKPARAAGITGTWLLASVATESVSTLGTLVAPAFAAPRFVLLVSLCAFFAGGMLYVFLAALLVHRLMVFRVRPEQLTPDYWIAMGAPAITTLAGALLVQAANRWILLRSLTPFLLGASLAAWTAAASWIPLLLLLALRRHFSARARLVYSPDTWTLVFPLGMFAAATFMLSRATGLTLERLRGIADVLLCVALLAWFATAAGMFHRMVRGVLRPPPYAEPLPPSESPWAKHPTCAEPQVREVR